MSVTEREKIESDQRRLKATIAADRERLAQQQSGWTDADPFVTNRLRQRIALAEQALLISEARRRQLVSADENGSRSGGSVFFGSNF